MRLYLHGERVKAHKEQVKDVSVPMKRKGRGNEPVQRPEKSWVGTESVEARQLEFGEEKTWAAFEDDIHAVQTSNPHVGL